MCVNIIEASWKNAPSREACCTPWLVRSESRDPALGNFVSLYIEEMECIGVQTIDELHCRPFRRAG